jgi:glycosidase
MNCTRILSLFLFLSLCLGCNGDDTQNEGMDPLLTDNILSEPDKLEKITVYQVFTRLFGNQNTTNVIYGTAEQNGVGKFADFTPRALEALRDMGYTHVWYTGVLEHAVVRDYREYGIRLDDADVVKGRAGSPYAIKDYYDVNPDLAIDVDRRLEEFDELVDRTHAADLKVIIDFVPNHVARDYYSDKKPAGVVDLGAEDDTSVRFAPNNNFYYLPGEAFRVPEGYVPIGDNDFPTKDGKFDEVPAKVSGNNAVTPQPSVNDWFETVKLNYGLDLDNDEAKHFDPIPRTWHQMLEILTYWAERGVDGFRCDFVQFTPHEFWGWAIPQVKEINPDIIFLAEIYVPEWYDDYLTRGKFDYLYDKVQLYDTLRHLMTGSGSTDNLPGVWKALEGQNKHLLRFLENHDEQRIASRFFSGDPRYAIPAMAVSALWYTGPVMVYFGQEDGEPALGESGFGGDDGRTTMFDYWSVPEHLKWVNGGAFDGGGLSDAQRELRAFYRKLLHLSVERPSVRQGDFLDLHPYNRAQESPGYTDKQYAFLRYTVGEVLLVVTNFAEEATQGVELAIPDDALKIVGLVPATDYTLEDLLGDAPEVQLENGKLSLSLSPLSAHAFRFTP